jgi:hypothetical protein
MICRGGKGLVTSQVASESWVSPLGHSCPYRVSVPIGEGSPHASGGRLCSQMSFGVLSLSFK